MLKSQITSLLWLLVAALPVLADETDALKSGLQVGDTIASFNVEDVTGPAKGKSICYACRYGTRPVVNVFVREMTPEVVKLIGELDKQVAQHKDDKLQAFVVLLSLDPESDREQLVKLNKEHSFTHVPLTIFDGMTGPKKCRITQHAEVTVIMWNQAKVKANHAFATGKLDQAAVTTIVKEVPQLLR